MKKRLFFAALLLSYAHDGISQDCAPNGIS
ncbi:MAG: hypothetical protein RLZZ143_3514, partial [Cyanobacteriota bacterium]